MAVGLLVRIRSAGAELLRGENWEGEGEFQRHGSCRLELPARKEDSALDMTKKETVPFRRI